MEAYLEWHSTLQSSVDRLRLASVIPVDYIQVVEAINHGVGQWSLLAIKLIIAPPDARKPDKS